LETNGSTVTLTAPATAGDQFLFQGGAVITGDQVAGTSVSFVQAGTGAVTQNMQQKVRESVSVKDFGAIGNALADDTAAIQAAINYAQSLVTAGATSTDVLFPHGQYLITSTLKVTKNGIVLRGESIRASQIVRNTDFGDSVMFSNTGTSSPTQNLLGVGICDLLFYHEIASWAPPMLSGSAVVMYSCQNSFMTNLFEINHFDGFSIYGGSSINCTGLYGQGYNGMPTVNSGNCQNRSVYNVGYLAGAGLVNSPAKITFYACGGDGGFLGGGYPALFELNYAGVNFGPLYGMLVTGGEQVEFINCQHSNARAHNFHVELSETLPTNIFEIGIIGGYYDTAGFASVWFGSYAPAGTAMSKCIVNTRIIGATIKASGIGGENDGIVIDGTVYTGTFTQIVRGIQISDCIISAQNRNGIYAVGGVDVLISNNIVRGNNISNGQTCSFNGAIAGTTLTVSFIASGYLCKGMTLNSPGSPVLGAQVFPLLTGESVGGKGRYDISAAPLASTSIIATVTFSGSGIVLGQYLYGSKVIGNRSGGGADGLNNSQQLYGVRVDPGTNEFQIENNDLRLNLTSALLDVSTTISKIIVGNFGFNGNRPAQFPVVPASGANFVNPFGSPCTVSIYSGTVTDIKLNGTTIFTASGVLVQLGPNDVLNITYSSAPSWIWWPQ
jgi:hypothetical protein